MAKSPNIDFDDAEIAALMDELETELETEKASVEIDEKPSKAEPQSEIKAVVDAPASKVKAEVKDEVEIEEKPVAIENIKEDIPVAEPSEEEVSTSNSEPVELVSAEAPANPKKKSSEMSFFIDVTEFNKETKLTEATLDKCMIEQAGLRSWYGAQAAYAEAQHDRLKVKFDVLEAGLYDHHRKELAASGEKVTEKMVENAVKLDSRWLKGKNAVIEAETIANVNKSLVTSLADRRDMMIQLGADRRDEYKGAARVLAEREEHSSMASKAKNAAQSALRGLQ